MNFGDFFSLLLVLMCAANEKKNGRLCDMLTIVSVQFFFFRLNVGYTVLYDSSHIFHLNCRLFNQMWKLLVEISFKFNSGIENEKKSVHFFQVAKSLLFVGNNVPAIIEIVPT